MENLERESFKLREKSIRLGYISTDAIVGLHFCVIDSHGKKKMKNARSLMRTLFRTRPGVVLKWSAEEDPGKSEKQTANLTVEHCTCPQRAKKEDGLWERAVAEAIPESPPPLSSGTDSSEGSPPPASILLHTKELLRSRCGLLRHGAPHSGGGGDGGGVLRRWHPYAADEDDLLLLGVAGVALGRVAWAPRMQAIFLKSCSPPSETPRK